MMQENDAENVDPQNNAASEINIHLPKGFLDKNKKLYTRKGQPVMSLQGKYTAYSAKKRCKCTQLNTLKYNPDSNKVERTDSEGGKHFCSLEATNVQEDPILGIRNEMKMQIDRTRTRQYRATGNFRTFSR
jgi:hypothetical protein